MERELDKTERISLQLIVAGLLIGPIVGFLYLFSVLGSGPRTYEWVTAPAQSGGRQFYPLTGVYAGILFLLYLCDAFLYWTTPKLVALRQFLLAVAAIAFVLSTIFVMENYAYMPVRARARGTPHALRSARAALHPRSRASDRVSRASRVRARASDLPLPARAAAVHHRHLPRRVPLAHQLPDLRRLPPRADDLLRPLRHRLVVLLDARQRRRRGPLLGQADLGRSRARARAAAAAAAASRARPVTARRLGRSARPARMTMPTVRPSPRAQLDLASKSACKVDEKEIVCDLEETFCNATTGVCTVVEDAEETYETCLVAFVVWVMPMVVAFSTIFFGFVCAFLQPGGAEGQQHISPKFFAQLMILMLFALWCAASLSSAAPEITEAFVAFTMVSVIAIGMLVVGSYGVSRLVYETNNNAFVKDTIAKCARGARGLAACTHPRL